MTRLGPKPTPAQARLLATLHMEPRLLIERVNAFAHFAAAKGVPKPRREDEPGPQTLLVCAKMGWIENITPECAEAEYGVLRGYSSARFLRMSDLGKQWAERLQPTDLVAKPRPRISVKGQAARILRALCDRHPEDMEWVRLVEYMPVPHGTGLKARSIDLFALNCFVSQGFARVGYEIKVTRSDFLSDIRKVRKVEDGASVCSEFFFAVPWGLVKPTEVPDPYGLVYVGERGYSRIVKPSSLPRNDMGPGWAEVAAMLRRMREMYREDQ